MVRRLLAFVLVGGLLGCSSLTRPDGDELGVARVEPTNESAPTPTIANPTNGASTTTVASVALAPSPQPAANAPAQKQGG